MIGLGHLDASRCRRTGRPDYPVIYMDRWSGHQHKLRPWQVIPWVEFPSPIETMNGAQLCAVSRVLRAAQLLKDVGIYNREKVGGSNPSSIWLVNGIKADEISDAMEQHRDRQANKGNTRYLIPLVMASLDPTANIGAEEIKLASLPDGWSLDDTMRWYINQLAIGFGSDYQDFAPLPGRALGSGTQSVVLHQKSRGKGPALFIKTLEHLLNFHGVLPGTVNFRFDEQDMEEDAERSNLQKVKAETRTLYVTSGILSQAAIRQQMLDDGDISEEVFALSGGGEDLTDNMVAGDGVHPPEQSVIRRITPASVPEAGVEGGVGSAITAGAGAVTTRKAELSSPSDAITIEREVMERDNSGRVSRVLETVRSAR